MKTKRNINPIYQPLFHTERYGSLFLLICLIIGLEISFTHASSYRQGTDNGIQVENIEGLGQQKITSSHHHSHHSNYFTENSEESKVQEDDDDKLDDDWLHKNQSFTQANKERVEFFALATSLKNTKKAKLFVLFHSWKHFLG